MSGQTQDLSAEIGRWQESDWQRVWFSVATDLDDLLTAGLGHLLTEDVRRSTTSKALVRNGVMAERLANEWRGGRASQMLLTS